LLDAEQHLDDHQSGAVPAGSPARARPRPIP
jgi:hypothetical protein